MEVIARSFEEIVIYQFLSVIIQVMRILPVQKQDVSNEPANGGDWSW